MSKKSHSAVNIISIISVAGVAVATAAIVIVLSVYNGFSLLVSSHLSKIDPDVKIAPKIGKVIENSDSIVQWLSLIQGVAHARAVVEERGLVINGNTQMPVIFKGIDADYLDVVDIDSIVIDGAYMEQAYGYPGALLSVGVALKTDVRPGGIMHLYVPRRTGRINAANPSGAFREAELMATGVTQIGQQEYDNDRMYIPLATARAMLEYDTEATSIEIAVAPDASPAKVAKAIEQALANRGIAAKVMLREMQEEASFRMIKIEKWVTFLMLSFILAIASFNILSTLSLLVIEKRENMQTLQAMGATKRLSTKIFIAQGWLVSMAGGLVGIMLGTILSMAQQYGKFIKLAADPSQLAIAYYPVELQPIDLLVVAGVVGIVALVSSQATRLFNR